MIFPYLPDERFYVDDILEPKLMILRHVHLLFRRPTQHYLLAFELHYDRVNILVTAERRFAYLFTRNTYSCYGYLSVLSVATFKCI